MRDWKDLVQKRLVKLNLPPSAKEEVILELAAHLEDSVAASQEASEAADPELAQLQWRKLLRAIERTKCEEGKMNRRTKTLWLPSIGVLFTVGLILLFLGRAFFWQQFIFMTSMAMFLGTAASESNHLSPQTRSLWLPALTTFFGASLSLMTFQFFGMQPHLGWIHGVGMTFYWPWLASLPIFGAAGAFLSRRAQGLPTARLAAGLFPVFIMLTVMLLILPLGLAIDGMDFFRVVAFGIGLINWVALPGIALLLGAAPFLRDSRLQEA